VTGGAVGERVGRGAGDRREPAPAPRLFLRSRASTRRLLKLAAAVLVGLLAAFLALVPIGRYLARAGWEEGKILLRRRPIAALVADPRTDAGVRAKLQVVLDARHFAADSLRMRAGESFTTYSALERDTLVLVLSAAYRDRLKRHTWWFPIVGSVPYKGFFDFDQATRAARGLDAEGLDAYLRPASAFSTLGFFNDPLLSTTLRLDSLELANTVIHELTHNTYYAPGQAVFNESFANFAGARGAAWFFRTRGSAAAADETDRRWADQIVLGRFWTATYRSLDSAFTRHPDSKAARLAARDTVYARARQLLVDSVAPRLVTIPPAVVARTRLDNAALLARRIYLTDLDLFEQVYVREGRDARRAIDRVIALARSRPDDPYAAVRAWLGGGATGDK
jgi:predicted aminopeptidase